jgi:hypothetical protein
MKARMGGSKGWVKAGLPIVLVVLLFIFFSHRGLGQKQDDVKTTMHEFLDHILSLQPVLTSQDTFNDPKNKMLIEDELTALHKLTDQAAGHSTFGKTQYRFSRQALHDQFDSASRAYNYGNKEYARDSLNASLSLCMSCHTQLPAPARPSSFLTKLVKTPQLPEDMYKQAELVFVMWEYDWALALYDQIIAEYPKNKLKSEKIRQALERKLTIFARVKRDPKAAIVSFKKDLRNQGLPDYLKNNIRFWITEFESWNKNGTIDVKAMDDAGLEKYVSQNLDLIKDPALIEKTPNAKKVDSPNMVSYLKISGILFEYLNTHPDTKLKPEILYRLSLCDSKINYNFFYSLSDLYLKECVVSYPKFPIAQKCFDQYKNKVLSRYMVHYQNEVPDEVKAELKELESKLNNSHGL